MGDNFALKVLPIVLAFCLADISAGVARSFTIDFDNNTFLKDGKPYRYVSGSIHMYRLPRALWEDRLTKMRASGLNAIETYIFWAQHEPTPGVYDFDGQNNLFEFIALAQKIGFDVILRAGPYSCGETDYGALPWWLLSGGVDQIRPRSSEPNYMFAVNRWFKVLLPKLEPYLYKNGGPIITVQVENEYGSYTACDAGYMGQLRDLFRQHLGDDTILFTTDGNAVGYLRCGSIPGLYPTVDFGVGANINDSFQSQRKFAPQGPLVNSEFYPGWLDFWGSRHAKVDTKSILKTFNQIMDYKANVNFYMFYGGTNYGFLNGADPPYLTQPTSYDYDAPISEAGDVTDKYMAIRNAIGQYFPLPQIPIPANSTKVALGKTQMTYHFSLIDAITELSDTCVNSAYPQSFERLGQGYGFVLYKTELKDPEVFGKVLSIPGIRDRGYVQIGSSSVGYVYRVKKTDLKINLKNNKNTTLYIVVENMGRLNYGSDMHDTKGILSEVTLDGQVLSNWTACLTNNFIPDFQKKLKHPGDAFFEKYMVYENLLDVKLKYKDIDFKAPAVYIGEFTTPKVDFDTFLKAEQFTKGIALVSSNDTLTNLGRYWPKEGPQVTLYTPGVFMTQSSVNKVVLVEFEESSCQTASDCYVEFIDYPIIDNLPASKNGLRTYFNKQFF